MENTSTNRISEHEVNKLWLIKRVVVVQVELLKDLGHFRLGRMRVLAVELIKSPNHLLHLLFSDLSFKSKRNFQLKRLLGQYIV